MSFYKAPNSLPTSFDASPGPTGPTGRAVIVVTDVGDDIDDAAALVVLLKMLRAKKIDKLIVITAGEGDHVARATYCGLLVREVLGYPRTSWTRSLPVLIYTGVEQGLSNCKYLTDGIRGHMEALPNVVEGTQRILSEASQAEQVLVLVLAPMGRGVKALAAPLRDMNGKENTTKFCIMGGALETTYDGQEKQEAFAEYNVRKNVPYWKEFVSTCAQNNPCNVLLCPLDACGAGSRIPAWGQVLKDSPQLFKYAWDHWLKAQKEKGAGDNPVLTRIEKNDESQLLFDVRALYDAVQFMGWDDDIDQTPYFRLEEILVYTNGMTLMVPRDSEDDIGNAVVVAKRYEVCEDGSHVETGEVIEAVPDQVKVSMQPSGEAFRSWTRAWLTKSFAVSKRAREEPSGEEEAKKSKSE